ncbi:uncharacterized protein [Drosophila kikkawai]|uniref:Peptidase A2 domain-containing protein n=1 Tax=Drosophila kikkawai TaxID=30033 RepID=A0ABM4GFV1_DROKI
MNAIYALPRLQKDNTDSIRSMLSTVIVCLAAFRRVQALDGERQHWLAHYIASKLPKETHNAWEHHQGSGATVPTYQDLESFLNNRLIIMDAIENRSSSYDSNNGPGSADPGKRVRVHSAQEHSRRPNSSCYHCSGDHILRRCAAFLALDCYKRKDIVSRANVCINCLSKAHALSRCTSNKSCQICGQRHHTLLHFPALAQDRSSSHTSLHPVRSATTHPDAPTAGENVPQQGLQSTSGQNPDASYRCYSATSANGASRNVLLATARIAVRNPVNWLQAVINALIDQGSEATIVSKHVVQSLHLRRCNTRASIFGVGPEGDPNYARSKRVDLILGVDMLAQIMLPDTRIGLPGEPIAQNTRFGWILSGRAEGVREATQLRCHRVQLDTEALLKRFCEVESVPDRPIATEGDLWCESFFQKTHVRRPDGRYVVRLPFKTYLDRTMVLGKSHQMALNRFLQMERRLSNNPDRWSKYVDEIEEYFALEQIAPAMDSESSTVRSTAANRHVASCVLPHHAVFKKEIQSTKQRIVFDASSRTSNGKSLNDILWTGPTLQNDMSAIILNWRNYRFVFTADIQKMYRCIDVHPEDAQYQRILWRAADGSINVYALTTLTFGTASAPFMAIRVIQQLAKDEQCSFPKAEEVLRDEIYVDDILSGGHTIEDASACLSSDKQAQVSGAIKSACMELRKWSSNEESLLQWIPPEHQCSRTPLNWDTADPIKALGMYWLPNKDCFKFQVNFEIPPSFTKRTILSSIARLFDPLGLIAPVIISDKLILMEVTMAKKTRDNGAMTALDWDDEVPKALAERWQAFRDGLLGIDGLSIQRVCSSLRRVTGLGQDPSKYGALGHRQSILHLQKPRLHHFRVHIRAQDDGDRSRKVEPVISQGDVLEIGPHSLIQLSDRSCRRKSQRSRQRRVNAAHRRAWVDERRCVEHSHPGVNPHQRGREEVHAVSLKQWPVKALSELPAWRMPRFVERPTSAVERPESAEERPKRAEERPQSAEERPKSAEERSKRGEQKLERDERAASTDANGVDTAAALAYAAVCGALRCRSCTYRHGSIRMLVSQAVGAIAIREDRAEPLFDAQPQESAALP